MGHEFFSPAKLDELAMRGDTELDPMVSEFLHSAAAGTAGKLLEALQNHQRLDQTRLHALAQQGLINQPIEQFFIDRQSLPELPWIDAAKLQQGGEFFRSRGVLSFMVLAFASLPACYCWRPEAQQLASSGQLDDPDKIPNRLPETAQFVLDVIAENALASGGSGIAAAAKVRLIHAVIRQQMQSEASATASQNTRFSGILANSLTPPLSQELMTYTLLTFHHVVVSGLIRLGFTLEKDYIDTYLQRWNAVGLMLGIDREVVENLQHYADTEKLYAISMHRYRGQTADGAALLHTLINYTKHNIIRRILFGLHNPFCFLPKIMTEKLSGREISAALGLKLNVFERLFGTILWWLVRLVTLLRNKGWFNGVTEFLIHWATAHVWDLRKDSSQQKSVVNGNHKCHVIVSGTALHDWRCARALAHTPGESMRQRIRPAKKAVKGHA